MKAAGLALCAVLLAAFAASCAPPASSPPPPPPPPVVGPVSGGGVGRTSCTFNASQVVAELVPGFNAVSFGACASGSPMGAPCPNPPTANTNPSNPQRLQFIQQIIQQTFDNAPPHLQCELSTLGNIFVDTDLQQRNGIAWGMRDRSRAGAKHIGLSTTLFSQVGAPPPPQGFYPAYETQVTDMLLTPPSAGLPSNSAAWLARLSHSSNPDSPVIKTMAVLAHEMGHIIWWAENIPAMTCQPTGGAFQNITWDPRHFNNPHGFHGFGNGQMNQSKFDNFNSNEIARNLQNGRPDTAGSRMQQIYTQANWANLFSFVAPDEDFIETYKLWALTNAQGGFKLVSLKANFLGSGGAPLSVAIVPANFFGRPGTNLDNKRRWIESYVAGPAARLCAFPTPIP